MKLFTFYVTLALSFAPLAGAGEPGFTPDFGDQSVPESSIESIQSRDVILGRNASVESGEAVDEDRVGILIAKTRGTHSPSDGFVVFANPGKHFRIELTAEYATNESSKLAANLLLKKAEFLNEQEKASLKAHHSSTWHFDTGSRPGYESVDGEGQLEFDLIGLAPKKEGTFKFSMNLGLFDKKTWGTKLLKIYDVTLITDRAIYDTLAARSATLAIQEWRSTDGRTISASFVRIEKDAVILDMNGKKYTVPFSRLDAESLQKATRLSNQIQ